MIQARRPAGTPVGGQFAPTHRPEAAGIELADAPEATGTTVPVGLGVNLGPASQAEGSPPQLWCFVDASPFGWG